MGARFEEKEGNAMIEMGLPSKPKIPVLCSAVLYFTTADHTIIPRVKKHRETDSQVSCVSSAFC